MAQLPKWLGANSWRAVRWPTALVILLVAIIGSLRGWFEVCTTISQEGGMSEECSPPSVTDLGVVAVAALVAFLTLPDLGEVGLFGVSLRRRVEETERQVGRDELRVGRLENLFSIQQTKLETMATSRSEASTQVYVLQAGVPEELLDQLDEKQATYQSGVEVAEPPRTPEPSDEAARASTKLMSLWGELSRELDLAARVPRPDGMEPDEHPDYLRRKRFVLLFGTEIRAVEATREAVVQAIPVPAEDIENSVALAERLLAIWRGTQPTVQ